MLAHKKGVCLEIPCATKGKQKREKKKTKNDKSVFEQNSNMSKPHKPGASGAGKGGSSSSSSSSSAAPTFSFPGASGNKPSFKPSSGVGTKRPREEGGGGGGGGPKGKFGGNGGAQSSGGWKGGAGKSTGAGGKQQFSKKAKKPGKAITKDDQQVREKEQGEANFKNAERRQEEREERKTIRRRGLTTPYALASRARSTVWCARTRFPIYEHIHTHA